MQMVAVAVTRALSSKLEQLIVPYTDLVAVLKPRTACKDGLPAVPQLSARLPRI